MFATLLGPLPRPPLPLEAPVEALVDAAVRAQEVAGLEPVTDGGQRRDVEMAAPKAWETTARSTDRAVKHVILGPYTRARAGEDPTAHATRLNRTLRDLALAGCPLIEIHEPAASDIGADPAERARFREASLRLLDGLTGPHLSLAITGGNADTAGIETILAGPYDSLAVDLVAGPDNWRLVTTTPGDRGIVCGALSVEVDADEGPETLLWAAGYAAASRGRGPARVGLATSGSLAGLTWLEAVGRIEALGRAARIAVLPAADRRRAVDPRSISSRTAALGRVEDPPPSRRPRPDGGPT